MANLTTNWLLNQNTETREATETPLDYAMMGDGSKLIKLQPVSVLLRNPRCGCVPYEAVCVSSKNDLGSVRLHALLLWLGRHRLNRI